MFGLSGGEVLTLIVLAFILMGPKSLPENMRKAARFIKRARDFASNATASLREELGPEYSDLNVTDLHPKNFIKKQLGDVLDSDILNTKAEIENQVTEIKKSASIDPDLL
jgi:sec-independent protein translocase protein TatB